MKYFENEELITASEGDRVVLTNRRIRQTENTTDFTSIMLEKISSVEVNYHSWMWMLVAGIMFIVAGLILAFRSHGEGFACLGIGAICILGYFITRKHIVSISSDGGAKITFVTQGMSKQSVLDFTDKIEEVKSRLTITKQL